MLVFLPFNGSAQNADSSKRTNQDCTLKITEQLIAEAKKLKMEINPKSLSFNYADNLTFQAVLAKGVENLSESDFSKGKKTNINIDNKKLFFILSLPQTF